MEEKKSIKISLSFILLIVAIMIIILLVFCLYFQKTSYNQQIATLENNIYEMTMNSSSMQNKIDDLQGKLGSIANIINEDTKPVNTATENVVDTNTAVTNTTSNTTTENTVKEESTQKAVDHEFTIEEAKNIISADNDTLKTFFTTYAGKYVKVTGFAVDIGQDLESFDGVSYYINLSEENVKDRVYICGYSQDKQVFEELKKLSPNQKVTIYGTVYNGTLPLTLTDITIEE